MKSYNKILKTLKSSLLFTLIVALPSLAWGQKKTTPSAPKPAAPTHAAPAHPATQSHTTTSGHSATTTGQKTGATRPGTTSRTGTTSARTGTTRTNSTAGRPGTTAGKGTMGKPGTAGKTATTGRPATTTHAATNRTPPGRTVALKGGGRANIRPNGQIRSVDRNGMHIEHGMHGGRTVVSEHNGARVVTTGRHGGYVQRPYVVRNGHTYVSRTYVVNGRAYSHVYRSYYYGGRPYYGYYPAYYYNPGFYGWAYNPWAAPVAWGWGWGGAPWYGFYGGYFAPYPVYPSAAFWLTDYLISANLQAAYAAQAEANAAAQPGGPSGGDAGNAQAQDNGSGGDQSAASNSNAVVLTPEVKQAIAEEVKAQLAAEKAASGQPAASTQAPAAGGQPAATTASNGEVPAALDPAHTTFVVASDLAVVADGQECGLTAGDVITRTSTTPDSDQKVTAIVTSSKKSDCAGGKTVAVSVDDLQEMHNHFQEQIDDGLKTLASKQGTGGLPKAPDTSTVAGEVPAPPPDTSAANALQDQQAAADQTEAQVVKEAFNQGS
jgi:hypothetical protein